jgi:hypothetical protein
VYLNISIVGHLREGLGISGWRYSTSGLQAGAFSVWSEDMVAML